MYVCVKDGGGGGGVKIFNVLQSILWILRTFDFHTWIKLIVNSHVIRINRPTHSKNLRNLFEFAGFSDNFTLQIYYTTAVLKHAAI